MSAAVYKYGLLPPTDGAAIVDEQMRLAHRYQNRLVEIERDRRRRRDEILSAAGLAAQEERLAALERQREEVVAAVKQERMEARSRRVKAPAALSAVKAQIKAAREMLRDARLALRQDERTQERLRVADESSHETAKCARAECGLYWGTYLIIEQAHDAARKHPQPPRFRRFDGRGAVAVQIQHGMGVAEALACNDGRLRIRLEPSPIDGRGGKPLPRALLRVGSDGRAPIWAEWPLIYHRPLPMGARIKWAKVVRERVGTKYRWSLHVTLEDVPPRTDGGNPDKAVAVNLSWRLAPEATTTAATYTATDGVSGVLDVDPAVPRALAKANELRSIRDGHVNSIRTIVAAWRDSARLMPEDLRERISNVGQWHAAARFAALALWWGARRFKGDEEVFAALEAWRRKDKHLYEWEANARRKALARRQDQFRTFAASLARAHGVLVVEKRGLDRLASRPDVGQEDGALQDASRRQRTATAPSLLRSALENAFRSRGGRVVEVGFHATAREMLEEFERSGGAEKTATARAPRFSKLHSKRDGAGAVKVRGEKRRSKQALQSAAMVQV